MPITPTYPGVYIEEIPSGVRTITGVATSITAFIGRAARGPTDEPIVINSFADYERIFGGLSLISTMSFAVRDFYLNGGRQAIIVRLFNGPLASPPLDYAATITLPADGSSLIVLVAANDGAWGSNLAALVDHDINPDKPVSSTFNLTIVEIEPTTKQALNTEKFLNVSVDPADSRFLPRVLDQNSTLVRVQKDELGEYMLSNTRPLETFDPVITSPPTSPPELKPNPIKATGGDNGAPLTIDQFSGLQQQKKGLYALEKADLFNLLCIPPYTSFDGTPPAPTETPTDVDIALIAEAAQYCKERRAMLIVDPRSSWTTKESTIKDFSASDYPGLSSPISNHSAIFFPRLRQPNPLRDNQIEEFVPCGAVAGVFARTDAQRGVWKAPAGQEAGLIGVPQLSVPLTDDENGQLNPLGINCLRAFPILGRLVWGARTLEGADRLASEWKYISVRRTALFIEESLYRGTQWVVFEPNDEPLWAQIRLNVGAFMQNLFRQGAFQGKTPREAYLVKCDKETTTQNDINLGIVNILVGFAPLKPAEFVFIKIQQLAGQIEV